MVGSAEEKKPLLAEVAGRTTHLTMFFAVACIMDQFGVNPIIVLPRAIILCGELNADIPSIYADCYY